MKKKEEVVKVIKTLKGRWEIYLMAGKKQYANRLISRNGKLICSNTGFNTIAGALKNIRAVQSTAI